MAPSDNCVNSDSATRPLLGGLEISQQFNRNFASVNGNESQSQVSTSVPSQPQSWRDPQIYLAAAASGKSTPSYYDITEFVTGNVEEEIIVGGNGSQQVILRSGPKKPKLESVSLVQWSVANLAILY